MKIEITLNKQDIERLDKLTTKYNITNSKLIKLLILDETNKLELEEYKNKYNEPTLDDNKNEYFDNPFGDSDLDDLDDWDFN